MGVGVRVAGAFLVLAVVVLACAWTFQRRLIYLPGGAPDRVAPGVSEVELRTDDGLVMAAWHLSATASARDVTVLVLPGNAGSRADRMPLAQALTARGLDVLLLDYRGYGGNPGLPDEEGLAADARAAHHHLVADRGVDPARVVLFGESLGAAVAVRLARERPVAGLVLRSPFTSLADVGAVHYPVLPVRLLLRDRFPVREQAAELTGPVVVVAGDADDVVPFEQSRTVADAARAQLVVVPRARHNDAELGHGPAVVDAVLRVSP